MEATEIIDFWFNEIEPSAWFRKDENFDALLVDRFSNVHKQASQGELFHWRTTVQGRLAEIIILDQFSRNMFRDTPAAFAQDTLALVLAQEAIARGLDLELEGPKLSFLYMPFMHSESLSIHEEAMKLFDKPGLEGNLDYEIRHKNIIEKFGRYPHRNSILERVSTAEEIEFLKQPGSSF